ncbi:hypothetical protein GLOTRDRAFT_81597 [Gloeophyllum trabeum ATCC 11539]|uniref:SET domain-containing protein n=1 Tax=Gloeophyllum trabeum (strain ATCC 11539 / FP-39264 / Madison 617) TaxID=670483 RepID=S7PTD1_GLOTA|nr:uncharacterized protein GLOTRDRAFT_81597 [Gloeophyllum trabeum ATCC 11539]EPQ51006.1 hypothetical protein GLOTRDRAFT_81597 [Gloeophyllum trabeum ATCC 11539]
MSDAFHLPPSSEGKPSTSTRKAPQHLNSTGCCIRYSEGKGRGVFATRRIDPQTVIEISPVLLFTKDEYRDHGRHTVIDHYTFKWRDGRMALALGLGSLFNHSDHPNVSYTLDTETESIRYTTTRAVAPDEELCIFYGHKLWFENADAGSAGVTPASEEGEADDGWGGLGPLADLVDNQNQDSGPFSFPNGDPNDIIPDADLPFTRLKLIEDPEEETLESVHTIKAWVVDLPDPKQTIAMLKWLRTSGLDDPSLAHLKRVRKSPVTSTTSLLLSRVTSLSEPPVLPADVPLPAPYTLAVPKTAALTLSSCKVKSTLWPTMYAPRRKGELEEWERGRVRWACAAMNAVVATAREAALKGELPIAAHVPVPYASSKDQAAADHSLTREFTAHDTRTSLAHPLKHAVINVIRAVGDYRAASPSRASELTNQPPTTEIQTETDKTRNGTHYLLTSLTLFTTHEPCIMCSMALLHSRVKEVVYLYAMEKTGGCGGVACLPRLEGVNHRFGIARWRSGGGCEDLRVAEDVDA